MLLSELLDIEQLRIEINRKYITVRSHPLDRNLRVYNYSHECAYDGYWTHETKICRGLIVQHETGSANGVVVARSFSKFFNVGEHILNHETIPLDEPFTVTSKEDGSLGILYTAPDGLPAIATRGSFESDQATWATSHLRATSPGCAGSPGELTRLFEIVYSENRIVLDYGDFEGLIHLATLHTETGLPVPEMTWEGRRATTHQFDRLEDLLGHVETADSTNQEGFVIYFPESNFRVKVKFAEYVKLHRILTGLSERRIWEHISQGGSIEDFIEGVPDEFFDWVRAVDNRLRSEHRDIILRVHLKAARLSDPEWNHSRKEIAQQIEDDPDRGLIFLALDEKFTRLYESVWAILRPAGNVTFRDDDDS